MKADRNVEVGGEIPSLRKTAYSPKVDFEVTQIHDEDYAKARGFRGDLVGGNFLTSYVLEMLYRYFGDPWWKHGRIDVTFVGGGAVTGDKLIAKGVITSKQAEDSSVRLFLDIHLENYTTGNKILVGTASCRVP